LNYEHPFPWVSGYQRVSDIMKVDITEFKVVWLILRFQSEVTWNLLSSPLLLARVTGESSPSGHTHTSWGWQNRRSTLIHLGRQGQVVRRINLSYIWLRVVVTASIMCTRAKKKEREREQNNTFKHHNMSNPSAS